jgi:hypothetical protein
VRTDCADVGSSGGHADVVLSLSRWRGCPRSFCRRKRYINRGGPEGGSDAEERAASGMRKWVEQEALMFGRATAESMCRSPALGRRM